MKPRTHRRDGPYGARFDWFVPDILKEIKEEIEGLTHDELLAASNELLVGARAPLA